MDVSGTGTGMNEFIKKRVDFPKLSDSFYTIAANTVIFVKVGIIDIHRSVHQIL